jgi:hypothetical protein
MNQSVKYLSKDGYPEADRTSSSNPFEVFQMKKKAEINRMQVLIEQVNKH